MKKTLLITFGLLTLTGCSQHSDLREWVSNQQTAAAQRIIPREAPELTVLEEYNPPAYKGLNAFDPMRLKDLKNNNKSSENAPDLSRSKEILENFDLDQLQYVGSLISSKKPSAFIQVDGHTYTVHIGNYVGSNYGKIIKIEPDQILIQETVENSDGDWDKREAQISLINTTGTDN